MKRRTALALLGTGVATGIGTTLYERLKMTPTSNTQRLPTVFIGHGSPMNAISNNVYTNAMNQLGQSLPQPRAILMVSAHWMTRGTWVTHMAHPKTIHDFHGFPQPLFDMKYPAPGSPDVADQIRQLVTTPKIHADDSEWGLDHGTWSVLKHMYPQANIPVVQLSLDMTQQPAFHFELGQKLKSLRDEGILIMGSGNIVHNLKRISWDENAKPYDWSIEFDEWVKVKALDRDFKSLVNSYLSTEAGRLSVPTPDHYYPLLYILGAADTKDSLFFDIEGLQNSAISMRSLRFE